ncbi:MAG: hypothetical protein KDA24_08580 [Deltaproteobacteria bacterium]|nr:hypothetical protein [Deltaproteobacteria bacterium]
MRTFAAASLCLLLSLAAGSAFAETLTHEPAKVEVDVPDGWTSATEDDALTVESPDGAVLLLFQILDEDELDEALDEVDKEVGKVIRDFDGKKPESGKVNGMDAVAIEGTGRIEDVKVEVGLALLATPADKVLLVLGLAPTAEYRTNEKAIDAMVASIRPVGTPTGVEVVYRRAKVKIAVPKGWTSQEEDDVLTLSAADESVQVLFTILEASAIDAALDELGSELDEMIKNPRFEEPEDAVFAGMPARILEGTGTIEGTAVELGLALIDTPADKVLLVLGLGEEGRMTKNQAAIDALFAGIRPLK